MNNLIKGKKYVLPIELPNMIDPRSVGTFTGDYDKFGNAVFLMGNGDTYGIPASSCMPAPNMKEEIEILEKEMRCKQRLSFNECEGDCLNCCLAPHSASEKSRIAEAYTYIVDYLKITLKDS